MRTLVLTSPRLMSGPDVVAAQRKLIAAGFLAKGQDDGQYGPRSSRASMLAHFSLGFAGKFEHSASYGTTLDRVISLVLEHKSLPLGYETRRRMRADSEKIGQRALDWLRPHVGDTEHPPRSNRVSWASEWYGVIGAWCAMGTTRALVEAGSKAFKRGVHYSYVPDIVSDAKAGRNYLLRVFEVSQGNLVCYDWNGDGVFDHVGIVDDPPSALIAGAPFTTIECNTSFDDKGDQSNGGACAEKDRAVAGERTVFVKVLH